MPINSSSSSKDSHSSSSSSEKKSASSQANSPTRSVGNVISPAATVPGKGSSREVATSDGPRRKRGRTSEGAVHQVPSESTGGGKWHRKGKSNFPWNSAEPACSVCGKKFPSWKGSFGHLRIHPDRPWRGAFPPDKGGDKVEDAGAGFKKVLKLDLAEETFANDRAGGDQETAGSNRGLALNRYQSEPGPSTSRASPKGFDLNLPAPEEDDEEEEKHAPQKGFDLNLPAPEEDDEEKKHA